MGTWRSAPELQYQTFNSKVHREDQSDFRILSSPKTAKVTAISRQSDADFANDNCTLSRAHSKKYRLGKKKYTTSQNKRFITINK